MNDYSKLNIEWCGEILAQIGYGVQTRNILRPLIEGKANVKLIPAEEYVPENRKVTDPFWIKALEESKAKPDLPMRINFSIAPQFRLRPGAINIGFMQWETTRVPNEWVPILNQMDYLLVPSEVAVSAYRTAGVAVPIKVLRPNISDPGVEGPTTIINEIPDSTVKFIFSSNWIPRKNHSDLITAFSCAFNGISDVALIIKTWPASDDTNNKRHIEGGVRHFSDRLKGINRPRVYLLSDIVNQEKVESIIRSCDVYVSASRAEGFDSATLTAMAMQKLVIGIPLGIREEYLKPTTCIPVDYSLEPIVDSAAPGYDTYQAWARPNMQSLMASMQLAYNLIKNPDAKVSQFTDLNAKQLGANAREKVLELYSPETNTPRIYNALFEIQNEVAAKLTNKPPKP